MKKKKGDGVRISIEEFGAMSPYEKLIYLSRNREEITIDDLERMAEAGYLDEKSSLMEKEVKRGLKAIAEDEAEKRTIEEVFGSIDESVFEAIKRPIWSYVPIFFDWIYKYPDFVEKYEKRWN